MIERLMMSNSPSVRFALLFLALPLIWLGWLAWVIAAGLVDALKSPIGH